MNEKIYKTMGRVGGGNIAMGAVLVVVLMKIAVLFLHLKLRQLSLSYIKRKYLSLGLILKL